MRATAARADRRAASRRRAVARARRRVRNAAPPTRRTSPAPPRSRARDARPGAARRAAQGRPSATRTGPCGVRAAELLRERSTRRPTPPRIRPAPTGHDRAFYEAPALVAPAIRRRSYIDTEKGTIQIELNVLDAPLTADNFVTLARTRLLQRHRDSSRRAELRRAGRRSARRRRGRARLHDPRRDQRAAVSARHGRHGARLGRHGRQPVLHHARRRSRISTAATPCSVASWRAWTSSIESRGAT